MSVLVVDPSIRCFEVSRRSYYLKIWLRFFVSNQHDLCLFRTSSCHSGRLIYRMPENFVWSRDQLRDMACCKWFFCFVQNANFKHYRNFQTKIQHCKWFEPWLKSPDRGCSVALAVFWSGWFNAHLRNTYQLLWSHELLVRFNISCKSQSWGLLVQFAIVRLSTSPQ